MSRVCELFRRLGCLTSLDVIYDPFTKVMWLFDKRDSHASMDWTPRWLRVSQSLYDKLSHTHTQSTSTTKLNVRKSPILTGLFSQKRYARPQHVGPYLGLSAVEISAPSEFAWSDSLEVGLAWHWVDTCGTSVIQGTECTLVIQVVYHKIPVLFLCSIIHHRMFWHKNSMDKQLFSKRDLRIHQPAYRCHPLKILNLEPCDLASESNNSCICVSCQASFMCAWIVVRTD